MTPTKVAFVAFVAIAAIGGAAFAARPTAVGEGEGQVDIVAWPGYIERGDTDKNYDWVTDFEKETGCKVNVKTAATSDEMVTLMNQGGFDLVTASGSGLDPHITLQGALHQARARVAGAWADRLLRERKAQADDARRRETRDRVLRELEQMLNDSASAPLGGLVGVPLVNVLEVNLALPARMAELAKRLP